MNSLTGNTEEIDYQAVCSHLQEENEGLRATLSRVYRFTDTMEDVRHIGVKVIQPFKKNPYLLVVIVYMFVSILDLILRRVTHER